MSGLPDQGALLRQARAARSGLRARPSPDRLERTGPGEESVWDFPRPPRVEAVAEPVAIRLGGALVAESGRALRVIETASPPVYYLPRADVAGASLVDLDPADGSLCEWKGWASYFDMQVGGRRVRRAGWGYGEPFDDLGQGYLRLRGHVAVYPALFDCFLGDERVTAQAGGFYGGWIAANLRGPWKGGPGTQGW